MPVATEPESIPDLGNFSMDWATHALLQDREIPDSSRPDARPPGEHFWGPPAFSAGHGWVNFGNTSSTSTNDPSGGATTPSDPTTTASTIPTGNSNTPVLNNAWSWPSSSYDGWTGGGGQSYSSGSASSPYDPDGFWDFDQGWDHFGALRTMLHDQPAMLDPVDPAPEPSSVFLLAALFGLGLLVARRYGLSGTEKFRGSSGH